MADRRLSTIHANLTAYKVNDQWSIAGQMTINSVIRVLPELTDNALFSLTLTTMYVNMSATITNNALHPYLDGHVLPYYLWPLIRSLLSIK